MKRLNIYNGLILTFAVILPIAWVCRTPVTLPEIGAGKMFCLREVSGGEGMADIKLHSVGDGDRQLRRDGVGNDDLDFFENEAPVFGNNKQSSFSSPSPRGIPRMRSANVRDNDKSSLFNLEKIDSFSELDVDSGSANWGWLADDVHSAERGRDSKFGSQKAPRRLFDDNNSTFGNHFGGDNNSAQESYFKRQDLRW